MMDAFEFHHRRLFETAMEGKQIFNREIGQNNNANPLLYAEFKLRLK